MGSDAGGQGRAHRECLTPSVVEAMADLGRQQGTSPDAVLATALALVLARQCGRRELALGVPSAGRGTALVRVRVVGEDTCGDLVRMVGKEMDEALAGRDGAGTGSLVGPTDLDAVIGRPGEHDAAGVDALLRVSFEGSPPQGLEVVGGRIDPDLVEATGSRLAAVVDRVANNPQRRVDEVRITTDLEAVRLAAWNDTGTLHPVPVPAAVVAQATRTPDATAVTAADATLSYRELVARAARLAHHLRSLGVGSDDVVGVMVPRTSELPVAVLGILLSGASYLPLDPTYPPDRLRFMLDDSKAAVVVTAGAVAEGLVGGGCRLVRLDADRAALDGWPATPPEVDVVPQSKAYVIYTSGSTGLPKGVVVEHRNVAAFVAWATRTFSPEELALVGAPTSLCFDLSVYELFAPLCVGGAVLLLENALDLADTERRGGPTLVNSVPSAMEALLRVGSLPPSVRTVNVCGEPLSAKLLRDLLATEAVERVCNLYGPTEDTVYSTLAPFTRAPRGDGPPDIGVPIEGTKAWLLDDFGHPVPPGVPGELHLGGRGVVRGYHGRPALTAERFVPDPFSGEPGARLYRTGDIVRQRADGVLEYLGRRDHQVKIRGHRVELPEIELALLRHPSIREAAVVVTGATVAERAPAAFVVLDGGGGGGPGGAEGEIERFVAERLPSYMVPQRITILDALPRTPNGKLDREALLRAEPRRTGAPAELRTATERTLAAIWCRVLGVGVVGPDDDFFRLGGQSLLAMQVVARVRDELGVELPLRVLFDERSLSAVAAHLDSTGGRRARSKSVVRRGRSQGPVHLAQLAIVKEGKPGDVPAVAPILRLTGTLDVAAMEGALNQLARRHESLRTGVRKTLRGYRQVVLPWEHVPLVPIDVRRKNANAPQGDARLIADLLTAQFDLANGPLIRWTLLRYSKVDHVLAIAVHEVAADGWSMPVLLSELATFYRDLVEGLPHSLPEPPVQYLDVAFWQRRTLRRPARIGEMLYWKARLREAPVAFDLMPDRWPSSEKPVEARQEYLVLDTAFSERLRALAREEGCTLYMVLFAGFQALLHRWSREPVVLLRSTVANRTTSEMESVVGFLINQVLVATDLSDNPTIRRLLARVRDDQLEIAGHTAVPNVITARWAAAMRSTHHMWPFGRLRFQVLNFPHSSQVHLPGLAVRPEPPPIPMSEHFAMLGFEQPDQSVGFVLSYDGAWFERATIRWLLSQYESILQAFIVDREARIDDVTRLDQRSADAVLRLGRGPSQEPPFQSISDLVAEQAGRSPDAPAVACGSDRLSYAALDGWADEIAAGLAGATGTAMGTRTGTGEPRVVVRLDGVAGIAAALGVLRAGAVCVPVSPALDDEVVARIVEHAGAQAVLTPSMLERPSATSSGGWRPAVDPDSAALALYCSGAREGLRASVVTHGALAQAAAFRRTAANLRRRDRVAVLRMDHVGRALGTIWSALACGATVVLPSEPVGEPGRWVADEDVTVCSADAASVPEIVATASETRRRSLRMVVVDEPVRLPDGLVPVHVEEVLSTPEAAVPILAGRATARSVAAPTFRGRVSAGTQVLVVDRGMNLMPPGGTGELFVDASHLARGFLGDPRGTALRFVPNPYADRPGARMVSTGVVGRLSSKDQVEVLGPAGEGSMRGLPVARFARPIEAAVRANDEVEAAFTRVEAVSGEPRLVLYVQRRRGLRRRAVSALLPADLPPAVQPHRIEFVEVVPRTLDGRVDLGGLGPRPRKRRTSRS